MWLFVVSADVGGADVFSAVVLFRRVVFQVESLIGVLITGWVNVFSLSLCIDGLQRFGFDVIRLFSRRSVNE